MDKYRGLHTNQRLLLQELESRGVRVEVLVPELELVEVRYQGKIEILLDRDSGVVPYAGSLIAADKYLSKRLLSRAGISVPRGEQFFIDQLADLMDYRCSITAPFVIKPTKGSHGAGCYMNLLTERDIELAVNQIVSEIGSVAPFLIEEQIAGDEIRVLINQNREFVALRREPPWIIGDGRSAIRQLIDGENRMRATQRDRFFCPITVDSELVSTLKRSGLDLSDVPSEGKKIVLRSNSNITSGGVSFDVTDTISDELVEMAFRALKVIPRLPYAGVDMIVKNNGSNEAYVLEINSNPGIKMHHLPAFGAPRNAARLIADMILQDPESA